MKIVVTGSAGFLGSRLVPELQRRGHAVDGWDIISDSRDLCDSKGVYRQVVIDPPEVLVHLAGMPGRLFCENDPAAAVRSNVQMTAAVARACAKKTVRLVFCSTSEVYGSNNRCDETTTPTPINVYGMTNWWAEQLCQRVAPAGLAIMRPTMPYSGAMHTGYGRAALPTFIRNVLDGEPLTVHRDTSRSWCYVDDVIRGMADVVERGEGIYNVGRDDDQRSMEDVADLVRTLLGRPDHLINLVNPDATVTRHKLLSTARLRDLGWQPTIALEEGILLSAEELNGQRLAA